ncbi:MAG: riboflavin biosynthesis protein RibF [Bacilli bacterium]
MQVWETDLSSKPFSIPDLTICLGYFDGLHLGHQSLIKKGSSIGHPLAVLTFDRNPKPGREQQSLTPLKAKKKLLANFDVDYLIIVQFNDNVKKITPQLFLDFLVSIGVKHIVCGPDFTFGNEGKGNVSTIQADHRLTLHVVNNLMVGEKKISTRDIVTHLDEGKLDQVQSYLGRPYVVEGIVGKGLGEGRKMGYPTANIVLDAPYYLPKNGVYITLIKIDNKTYYSLSSLGFHPTVANLDHPTLEVFVLNLEANLYEKQVEVAFLYYLRPEAKFPSKEALILQMNQDKARALQLQSTLPKDF